LTCEYLFKGLIKKNGFVDTGKIEDEDNVPTYAAVSLCCLSSSNPFRSRIIFLIFKKLSNFFSELFKLF
jgi:hypothetical protein